MARSGDVNTHSFPTRCLRSAGKNDPSRRLGIVRSASLASVGLARGLAHELGDHPGPAAAERAVLWWADVACRDARRRGRVHATRSVPGGTVAGMQQTGAALAAWTRSLSGSPTPTRRPATPWPGWPPTVQPIC